MEFNVAHLVHASLNRTYAHIANTKGHEQAKSHSTTFVTLKQAQTGPPPSLLPSRICICLISVDFLSLSLFHLPTVFSEVTVNHSKCLPALPSPFLTCWASIHRFEILRAASLKLALCILHNFSSTLQSTYNLEQVWANFLIRRPQWVLIYDREAGSGQIDGALV